MKFINTILIPFLFLGCAGPRAYHQITTQEPYDGVSIIQVEGHRCAVVVIDETHLAMDCWKGQAPGNKGKKK